MLRLPTDRKILEHIYAAYAKDFQNFQPAEQSRSSLIYVPIDVRYIATSLKTDPHILFGRLYYHLDMKYGYTQDDGSKVHLFAFKVEEDLHCINYPYLAAVVSEKRTEHLRNLWALSLSVLSLIVAVGSLVASITIKLNSGP
jgi:hypothetical protein